MDVPLVGQRGRGRRQRLGGRAVVGLGLRPGPLEFGQLVLGAGQPAGHLVGIAQVVGHAGGALLEHGGRAGLRRRGVGQLAPGARGGLVGRVARHFVSPAQLGHLGALVEDVGLTGQLALRQSRGGVIGCAAHRAGCAGFERGGQHGRLAGRPGRFEVGELAGRAVDGRLGGLERGPPGLGGLSVGSCGGLERRLGGAEGRRGLGQRSGLVGHGGKFAHLVGQRDPLRGARGLGLERRLGLAAGGYRPVERPLGQLEFEQSRREVVAAVVHPAVVTGQRLGLAREGDLGPHGGDLGGAGGELVGRGPCGGELVDRGGDRLGRVQRRQGALLVGGGQGRRRLALGNLFDEPSEPLAHLVGLDRTDRGKQSRAPGYGLLHLAFDRLSVVFEGILQLAIALGAKQPLEDLLALLAARLQQLLKLALGQHDDLAKLHAAKAEDLLDPLGDVGGLVGQRPALGVARRGGHGAVVGVGLAGRRIAAVPEVGGRVFGGEAVAAQLGPLLPGAALYAVALVADREVERDLGAQRRVGVV